MRALRIELNKIDDKTKTILGYLTYHAGKLWNECNYLLHNKLAKVNKYDIYNKIKNTSIHKKSLHSRTAQIVIEELVRVWKNFFDHLKNPSKYPNKVKPPKYVDKTAPHRTITYDKTGFKIKGNTIRLSIPKDLKEYLKEKFGFTDDYIYINTGIDLQKLNIVNIQIVPYKAYGNITFRLNIIYEKEVEDTKNKYDKVMAIDYGVSNFATIVIENEPISYIVDGGGFQSILQKYLKKLAKWQKKKDNLKNKGLPYNRVEKTLHRLQKRINNLIRDYTHKVSNLIITLAKKYDVSKIVIGDIQKVKNKESNLPDLINQMLRLLPYGKVSNALEYKAKEHGIETILINEAYTSGVDSTINSVVSKENYTPDRRIERGLFKSLNGLVNADVNGARNILKKFKKSWHDVITGLKQTVRLRVFGKLKGSPEFAVYKQIGVVGCGDHLCRIRCHKTQTPTEATTS